MFHSFELHDSPENPLEGFEDVDLGPPETFTRDILNDGQCVSPLTNDRVCDAGSCDPETGSPTIKKVRVPSEEAYRQAFSPFHKDIGTPYPCSQSDLDVHKTGSFEASNNHPFVSAMEATKEVMLHNHVSRRLPSSESTAIDNLNRTIYTVEKSFETMFAYSGSRVLITLDLRLQIDSGEPRSSSPNAVSA